MELRERGREHPGCDLPDGGDVGLDVHRAARIAAATHGGTVVVMSQATARLVQVTGVRGPRAYPKTRLATAVAQRIGRSPRACASSRLAVAQDRV
jgi:hypothetical protein